MASLKDKVILITGSGDVDGIGAGTALYLTQFEPKLVITGRNMERIHSVGDTLRAAGLSNDRLLLVTCDVTQDKDLEKLVKETIQKFGRLDVLVNNVAVYSTAGIQDTTMEDFDNIIRTNLRSPFLLTKLCLSYLVEAKGCVVNVSSIAGQSAIPVGVAYSLSKAALDHFTAILALELAPKGVRVNSVNPGYIFTNIFLKSGFTAEQVKELFEREKAKHPLGYVGKPVDVAKAITFLAADESSYITGQILFVDGGRHVASI